VATKRPRKTAQTATAEGKPTSNDTEKAAQQSHGGGFDQELQHDIVAPRAQRLANADLAGALGDRDQHDVHDDHAAHHQGNGGDADDDSGKHAGDLVEQADEGVIGEDGEVIFGADRIVATGAHEGTDFVDEVIQCAGSHARFGGDVEALVFAMGVQIGAQRHVYVVVFALPKDFALAFADADDGVDLAIDADFLADGVLIGQQVIDDVVANDDIVCAHLVVGRSESTALGHIEIVNLEHA
jgi:hypothetical protein